MDTASSEAEETLRQSKALLDKTTSDYNRAQGRTARHVIMAAERLDGKSAYVGCSRGRESCDVFTPDKAQLFAGLPFDGNRRAALDVLKEQRQSARARRAAALGRQSDKGSRRCSCPARLVDWATLAQPRNACSLAAGRRAGAAGPVHKTKRKML
jgi:hypothetical protein